MVSGRLCRDMSSQYYYGCDFSQEHYQELLETYIVKKILKSEQHLYKLKWFDYRVMHPTHATYLFAHEYVKAVRKKHRKVVDKFKWDLRLIESHAPLSERKQFTEERKRLLRIIKGDARSFAEMRQAELDLNFLEQEYTEMLDKYADPIIADGNSFWRGRQAADRLGMPYDMYCEHALSLLTNSYTWQAIASGEHKTYMPRPKHMYSDRVIEYVERQFRDHLSHSLPIPNVLKSDEQKAIQVKHDAIDWICEKIRNRRNSYIALANFMEKGVVDMRTAKAHFLPEVVENAVKFNKQLNT